MEKYANAFSNKTILKHSDIDNRIENIDKYRNEKHKSRSRSRSRSLSKEKEELTNNRNKYKSSRSEISQISLNNNQSNKDRLQLSNWSYKNPINNTREIQGLDDYRHGAAEYNYDYNRKINEEELSIDNLQKSHYSNFDKSKRLVNFDFKR